MSQHLAVLGAGNIAQAMAAHLAINGHSVRLYNRWDHEIAAIREKGAIELSGRIEGVGWLASASSNIEEVVQGASAVIVAVPAFAFRHMAEACAPFLKNDQIVLLHPGTLGSSLEFARCLRSSPLLVESAASLYIARISGAASVKVLTVKQSLRVAALPATRTGEAIERLAPILPVQLAPAENVLETGINNNQAVIHCPTVLLNFTRLEETEDWIFWQGITPGVANLIGVLDSERLALGNALGARAEPLEEFLGQAYGLANMGLFDMLRHVFSRGGGAKGPVGLDHRYIFEDVPYALVPWVSLALQLGVDMPVTRNLIDVFSAVYLQDMWALGRTVESMGLAGLDKEQIRRLVQVGPESASAG